MYYLVKIQSGTNGNSQTMPAYDTFDEALAAFHTEMAYRSATRTSTVCVILDDRGNTQKRECWTASGSQE